MNIVLNMWQISAIMMLTIVAGYLLAFFILKKPFSKLSEKAHWSLFAPKIKAQVQTNNLSFLEEFHRKANTFTHEERCILLQELFSKDVKLIVGLNKAGQFWIDGVLPYDYSDMLNAGAPGGDD